MKLPNWFKIIWWAILLIITTSFVYHRYDALVDGTSVPLDIFIFLIWIALLLIPLFQEISLFGIKLKNEIESLKTDLKEQMVNLRSDIQNTVDIHAQFSPQINFPPPSDSQIPEIEERFRKILEETLKTHGIEKPVKEVISSEEEKVPSLFYLRTRIQIEQQLNRLWLKQTGAIRQIVGIAFVIRTLRRNGVIDASIAAIIQDVYSICSLSIHGEPVTDKQLELVKVVAPALIALLKII